MVVVALAQEKSPSENSPARDIEQLFVLLKDAIAECDEYCKTIKVDLHQIRQSKETFSKLSLLKNMPTSFWQTMSRKNNSLFTTTPLMHFMKPANLKL